jgi:hypothetical protein
MAGRRRSLKTRENDARALEFRRRGLSYSQIAAQMEWRSDASAYGAVQRALADQSREVSAEVIQIETARLDELTRTLHRVLATKHYVVSVGSGKIARHPDTDQPLQDDGPVIQAVAGLLRISERRSKLLGLDAPARARVEVITEDVVDAEIARLTTELSEKDNGAHPSGIA